MKCKQVIQLSFIDTILYNGKDDSQYKLNWVRTHKVTLTTIIHLHAQVQFTQTHSKVELLHMVTHTHFYHSCKDRLLPIKIPEFCCSIGVKRRGTRLVAQ